MLHTFVRVFVALSFLHGSVIPASNPVKPAPQSQTSVKKTPAKKVKKPSRPKKAGKKKAVPAPKKASVATPPQKKMAASTPKAPPHKVELKKVSPVKQVFKKEAQPVIAHAAQPLEAIAPAPVAVAAEAVETLTATATTEYVLPLPELKRPQIEVQSLKEEPAQKTGAAVPSPKKEKATFEEIPLPASLAQKPAVPIRLLLQEFDATQEAVYEVSSPLAVFIQDPDVSEHVYLHRHHNLKVTVKDERLFVSTTTGLTRRLKKNHVVLHPVGGLLSINGTLYSGTVSLLIDPTTKKLLFVNAIDLEDYVYSVLACESGIMWDHEVQKVQAIATRSYAVHHLLQNLKSKNGRYYDLKTSNFHQVYRGHHKFNRLRPAVDETAGMVVTHNGEVAITMFDACCGGSIPANRKRPNLSKTPHLLRKKACTHCSNFSLYNWQYQLTGDDIMGHIFKHPTFQKKFTAFGALKDIKITEKDKAGVTYKIKMVGSRKNIALTTRELMSCLKKFLWSASFTITKKDDLFTLKGNGYGHQLGLCQHGARGLVNQGWKYQAILQFYYPQTGLKQIVGLNGKNAVFA